MNISLIYCLCIQKTITGLFYYTIFFSGKIRQGFIRIMGRRGGNARLVRTKNPRAIPDSTLTRALFTR